MPRPTIKKMTVKQKKFLKEYVKTGNATEAAMRSYEAKDRLSARNIGSENLAKLGRSIAELLNEHGLTDDRIAEEITKGAIEASNKTGDPDYYVRHRYLDTAAKLKDLYPSNKLEVSGKDGQPLQLQVLAGTGFLHESTNTKYNGNAQVADGGVVSESEEVQDTDMAQTGEENNDSDQ